LSPWHDDLNAKVILKAAVGPTITGDAPSLATIRDAFLNALTAQSAAADLFSRGIALQFGRAEALRVPALAPIEASFVQEGRAIPVKQSQATEIMMHRQKLAVIVLATNELLRSADAETLIRQMLIESIGPALDAAIFSTSPATVVRPAGILNGIAPLTSSANLAYDIIDLVTAVAPVSGNAQVALICSPDVAAAMNFLPQRLPYPILVSATLDEGTTICIALPAFVSAVEGVPQIEASQEAIVHAEDSAPATDIGGGVMASPLRSLYQSDVTGLKLRWPVSWTLRDPRGVAWTQR
jgi:hypothetical protein